MAPPGRLKRRPGGVTATRRMAAFVYRVYFSLRIHWDGQTRIVVSFYDEDYKYENTNWGTNIIMHMGLVTKTSRGYPNVKPLHVSRIRNMATG